MAATATMSASGGQETWQRRDAAEWSNAEVRAFLDTVLPGHECVFRFGHTTGRVLASLKKDELRKQVRDEEAANVIWAELQRFQASHVERQSIGASGSHPYTVFIRTPMDVCVELEVCPSDTVALVKERLEGVEGTPAALQRLMWNGVPMLDKRTLASYSISHESVILLVPRLSVAGQQRFAPPAASRGAATASSGIPRPRVPVVCTDIARPFPMSLEFPSIPEYQSFMLSLQREVGRRDVTTVGREDDVDSPFLEILPMSGVNSPVQTRIQYDAEAEVLLIDTVGDILMGDSRYNVLLHLRAEQKRAFLVTGAHT